MRPPVDDAGDVFIGVCTSLGLWRVHAAPVDLHGTIEPDSGAEPIVAALARAAEELAAARADVAAALADLVDALTAGE